MAKEIKLTDKQTVFIKYYLIGFNATQAAIKAGYSENTAQQMGSENLSKPVIKERIKEHVDSLVTDERILNEFSKIAFSNIIDMVDKSGDMKDFSDLKSDQTACIQEIKTTTTGDQITKTVKLHGKLPALNKLADIKGMITNQVKHSGEIKSGVIVVPGILTPKQWEKGE